MISLPGNESMNPLEFDEVKLFGENHIEIFHQKRLVMFQKQKKALRKLRGKYAFNKRNN